MIDNNTDKSIAVLPFVNMSSDPENEFFSDGITEEIINALTSINGLKVIARTSSFSFKNNNTDIREIGSMLGVTNILEGSVRKSSNRVRITAQLINTHDGTHYWSKNFDRELNDIFELQDEISLLIADQIRENFGHFDIQEHLIEAPTKNIDAYELFLKGHYFQLKWDPQSIGQAIELYELSVKKDPSFVRSYYGLVQSYGLMAAWGYLPQEKGFEKAINNFMIAQDLDKTLPDYGMSFVGRTFWMEWDFQITYEQLKKTLSDHPHYTNALEAMAELFIAHGLFDKAIEYIDIALAVDPLSANHFYTLGHIYYYQKDYTKAYELIKKALVVNPNFTLALELKALCLIWLNQKEEFEKLIADDVNKKIKIMLFNVINDNMPIATETVEEWKNAADDQKQMVTYELYILANSRHKQAAFELLMKYIEQKRGQIINFRVDPLLQSLYEIQNLNELYASNLKIEEIHSAKTSLQTKENTKIDKELLNTHYQNLLEYIIKEQPHLDAQLSLNDLASLVNMHPNKLSYLINEQSDKNFNEFINYYRLEHFKEIALDKANQHLTILGLAYESGFNSKTVFNTFFKKTEGTTPSSWLKSQQQ